MGHEEDAQKVSLLDNARVKGHLDYFRMSGGARAHLLVRRVGRLAPRIPTYHLAHALQQFHLALDAPEASRGNVKLLGLASGLAWLSREICWHLVILFVGAGEQAKAHKANQHSRHPHTMNYTNLRWFLRHSQAK